jgi:hypothetical protein
MERRNIFYPEEVERGGHFQAAIAPLIGACERVARAIEGKSRGEICCPRCGGWAVWHVADHGGQVIMCLSCADKLIPGFSKRGWQDPSERASQVSELLDAMVKQAEQNGP